MATMAPCKRCRKTQPGRAYLGCHGHCEDYISYRERHMKEMQQFYKDYRSSWTIGSEQKKARWAKNKQ